MASNYPTSLDSFTNPTSGDKLDSPSHSDQHSNVNDAVEAIETKVGIGASPAGSATSGHALVASTGGTTSWTTIGTAGISSGTATSGQILTANGSGGVSFGNGGLTLINTTSFSGVSSQALPAGTFSSLYKNYRIIGNVVGSISGGVNVNFRMRVGGTDNSTASSYRRQYLYGDTSTAAASNLTSDLALLYNADTVSGPFTAELFDPFETKRTKVMSHFFYQNVLVGLSYTDHNQTVSYDSINMIPSSGTITGSVTVYGYNQ